MENVKIALIQTSGFFEKEKTLVKMTEEIRKVSKSKPDIIVLPEMWNCPYGTKYFKAYGETENGETISLLKQLAKETNAYIFGGSISELENEKVYNTCYIFDRKGNIIEKHRKKHLFDIDIRGKITFRESDVLSAGDKITVVDTEFGKIGVAICFDVRFARDFAKMKAENDIKMIIIPAAFNMTTGPAHWQILMQARALDNQVYLLACAPALDENAPYSAYGHSMVVNPYGEILDVLDSSEGNIIMDIDLDYVDVVKKQIPLG